MKLRECIWVISGIFVALFHYALFKALVLSTIGCQFAINPCSDTTLRDTLIDVFGFPLWHLPTAIFAALPGVSAQNAEDLVVQAALNAALWGVITFSALRYLFPNRKAG